MTTYIPYIIYMLQYYWIQHEIQYHFLLSFYLTSTFSLEMKFFRIKTINSTKQQIASLLALCCTHHMICLKFFCADKVFLLDTNTCFLSEICFAFYVLYNYRAYDCEYKNFMIFLYCFFVLLHSACFMSFPDGIKPKKEIAWKLFIYFLF